MVIKRNIVVDGMEVPFKASATVPRLYRMKFGCDIFKDFSALQKSVKPENVPDNPDDWLEQFNTFSIYEILPQLLDLWGMNNETQAIAQKNIDHLTVR